MQTAPITQEFVFDVVEFRRALGSFPTGITVVTCIADGKPVGLTVNSFNSVSLHPPLIVWSLSDHLPVRPAFESCDYYAINILAHDQEHFSRNFASRLPDRFAEIDWKQGWSGVPLLPGCCAHLEVKNSKREQVGDHLLFIGEVQRFEREEHDPLVFFRGKYRHLQEI